MNEIRVDNGSRESGVLMPFRALPGSHDHQGTLGTESIEFLDYMHRAGFTVLQDLPISPPDPFNSPYSSDSAFAIDPQRIDLFQLAQVGDINRFDLDRYQKIASSFDAGPDIRDMKETLLRQAFLGFSNSGSPERQEAFARWCENEAGWLDKFGVFKILKDLPQNDDWRWQKWETGKDCSDRLVAEVKTYCEEDFSAICYEQWVANEQTLRYLHEADRRGIEIWGDVPFYVGHGEVWANRDIFNLDSEGNQLDQGGAAPSMTSATGQVWGFATYKVDGNEDPEQAARVIDWWGNRLSRAHNLNSGQVRLDHFIGFAEPYIIEADAVDGMNGHRDIGIGSGLFDKLAETYGDDLPFYPEDLGTQTEKTPELRDAFGLFANTLAVRSFTKHLLLGEYNESIHNPDNYHPNSVNISSNHDSPPLVEALDTIRTKYPQEFDQYIVYVNERFPHRDIRKESVPDEIAQLEMERVMYSLGRYAIMGIWDVLKLGPEGRYNVPDTIDPANWSWRMDESHISELSSQISYWRDLNASSGRSTYAAVAAAD